MVIRKWNFLVLGWEISCQHWLTAKLEILPVRESSHRVFSLGQHSEDFTVKGEVVNTLAFVGHVVSVTLLNSAMTVSKAALLNS